MADQSLEELLAIFNQPGMRREWVAHMYAITFMAGFPATHPVWNTLNRAIMLRWSPAGLTWIKKRAWAILEQIRMQQQASLN